MNKIKTVKPVKGYSSTEIKLKIKNKKKNFFSLSNPKELFNKIQLNTLSLQNSSPSLADFSSFSLRSQEKDYLLKRGKSYVGEDSCSPHMAPLSLGILRHFTVLNPLFIENYFSRCLVFLFHIFKKQGHILFVTHEHLYPEIIQYCAKKMKQSYCTTRWFGGALTNWKEIMVKKTSETFPDFVHPSHSNEIGEKKNGDLIANLSLEKQNTSKNRSFFSRKKQTRLRKKNIFKTGFTGKFPDVVFLFDPLKSKDVLLEAQKMNIPTIAFVDSNNYLPGITYPIILNTQSITSIYYIFHRILQTYNLATFSFQKNTILPAKGKDLFQTPSEL